jgi:signal transduction histidine kinase
VVTLFGIMGWTPEDYRSRATSMKSIASRIDTRAVIAVQVFGASGLFMLDILTPPGIADGVAYPIVLVLCLWIPGRKYLFGWALVTIGLTILAAFLTPGGGVGEASIINRGLAICSIAIVTILIAGRQGDVEKFKLLAKEAREADQAKSDFLANMSHELRTPLNAIIGFSELFAGEMFGPIGARYVDYARDIHASGIHLLSIINDVLDLSKIEAGQRSLSENVVDLYGTAESSLRLVRGRADSGRIRLVNGVPPDLPHVDADERAVKQILLNLLSNAVKFTPEGGRVAVTAEVRSDGSLTVSVDDTGIGMSPKNIPRALAPFSQVDSSLARRHAGTGLGLPLVKSLIELHRGTLELESEEGKGTLATIVFPADRVRFRRPSYFAGITARGDGA